MVIMIAIGVGIFLGFNIEWYSLETDTFSFFEDTGLADYRIISEKGFDGEDLEKVAALEGVDDTTRFLSVNTSVKDDTDVIAVNVTTNPDVSGFILTEGDPYDETDKEGMWLSDQYAAANSLSVGDTLTLEYKNFQLSGTIRGLIKSGEYLICVPDETQVMPDIHLTGDPSLLERLCTILLDNAMKYSPEGGKIRLTLKKDRKIRLIVSNTCERLDETDLNRLFDRFYRADTSRNNAGGFGLGLSAAQAICTSHKGTIKASREGSNTIVFEADFPA